MQPRRSSCRADLPQLPVGELADAVKNRVTPCLAAVVYVAVDHDPQQPSLEVCSRLKRLEGRTRFQHGFLHKVLRLIVVVGEAKGVAAQALPQRHDLTHEPCSQIGVRATPWTDARALAGI